MTHSAFKILSNSLLFREFEESYIFISNQTSGTIETE